jgi:hypothetical protein
MLGLRRPETPALRAPEPVRAAEPVRAYDAASG